MHFARADLQIDTAQDHLVLLFKFDVQVLDFKHDFFPFCRQRGSVNQPIA
jgi:hypothetical protein